MGWLIAEIKSAHTKALSQGHIFSVRLNGTSDIDIRQFKLDGLYITENIS